MRSIFHPIIIVILPTPTPTWELFHLPERCRSSRPVRIKTLVVPGPHDAALGSQPTDLDQLTAPALFVTAKTLESAHVFQ
jgi:hypothetical protein